MLDVLAALRRELIRAEFLAGAGRGPTVAKINWPALPTLRAAA